MNQAKKENNAVEVLKVTKYRNKYIVEITPYQDLESKETFSENQMVENRIFKGQVFFIEDWKEILKNKTTNDLFDKVLNYISFGLRTKKEIVEYLEKHDSTEEDSEKIIEKLEKLNLINDENYATHFLVKAINNRKGPLYVKSELKNKGIKSEIIDRVLTDYSYEQIYENINYIIKKELPSLNTYPVLKQKEKIYQKLLRMGYNNSQINNCLKSVEFTSNHEIRLKKEIDKLLNSNIDKTKIKQKLLVKGYSLSEINEILQNKVENDY